VQSALAAFPQMVSKVIGQ